MKYTGTLIAESLIDEAFLNFVSITERRKMPLEGATTDQLPEITLIRFIVTDDFAPAVVEEISKSLKGRGWYGSVEGEYEKFMIFPHKIFKYTPKDVTGFQKAIDYGKSLGIPDAQLPQI